MNDIAQLRKARVTLAEWSRMAERGDSDYCPKRHVAFGVYVERLCLKILRRTEGAA